LTSAAFLLDTHVLVWLLEGSSRIGPTARRKLSAASGLHISAITPWEIGMLVAKGRLAFDQDASQWIEKALSASGIHLSPLDPVTAVDASRLPGEFHGDPADRIIVSTARRQGLTLATADQAIIDYGRAGHLHTLDVQR
jgi:PIN domain nuclease of toxin-antitoxin system